MGSLLPWCKEYRLLNKAWFLQCTSVLCQPKIAELTTIFWPCLILWSEKGCNVKYYYAKCAPPLEPLSILMKLHLQWISAKLSHIYWLWFPLSSIVLLIGLAWLSFSARFKMFVSFLVAIILMVMTLQLFNMVLTFSILLE